MPRGPMEIICRDCRTIPEASGPELGLTTHIWCPDCRKDLKGEEATRMTVDEVRYIEAWKDTALCQPPRVLNRGPFAFGWPGRSRLDQAGRLRAIKTGLDFEAQRAQEPRQHDLLRLIASSYGAAADAVDPAPRPRG